MQISAEKTSGTYKDSFNEESSPDKAEKVVKLTQPKSEKFSAGTNEPTDKNNMIFLIMLLHGVAILIPWSSFMTIAPVYYTCYKFRKFDEYGIEDTTYSHNFFSFIALASQGPNLLLNFLNLFFTFSYGLGKRILVSVSIIATICCTTIIFVFIDSSNWVQEFFWITMLSIVILHSANGIFQNSLFGIAANLPHKMTTAIMIGSNLCGIYTAVLALIAITMSPSPKISATMFFSISLITILLCAVSFIYLSKSPYYLYHMKNAEKKQTSSNVESANTVALKWKVYKEIWKEGSIHFYNVFIVMFVTLAIFPAIQVHIRERAGFVIPRQYFTLIFTFLSFAFFSMIGALASKWILWPSPDKLVYLTTARLLFIPFFLACNYRPNTRRWPVIFENEWLFIVGSIFMSLSGGYLNTVSMINAPRVVSPLKSRSAGMLSSFALALGICMGVIVTFVEVHIIEDFGPLKPDAINNITTIIC